MSILITGGAGYIGSHITESLVERKYNVIILDNLKTGHKRLINVFLIISNNLYGT